MDQLFNDGLHLPEDDPLALLAPSFILMPIKKNDWDEVDPIHERAPQLFCEVCPKKSFKTRQGLN